MRVAGGDVGRSRQQRRGRADAGPGSRGDRGHAQAVGGPDGSLPSARVLHGRRCRGRPQGGGHPRDPPLRARLRRRVPTRRWSNRLPPPTWPGRTPNPCIECNRHGPVPGPARPVGRTGLRCSGHRAPRPVIGDGAGTDLLRAADPGKDQSYVLHMLGQDELARIRFPVGEMTKDEVRPMRPAGAWAPPPSPTARTSASSPHDHREFLLERFPEIAEPGPIVDAVGRRGREARRGGRVHGRPAARPAPGGRRAPLRAGRPARDGHGGGRPQGGSAGGRRRGVRDVVGGRHPPEDAEVEVKVRYRSEPVPARLVAVYRRDVGVGSTRPRKALRRARRRWCTGATRCWAAAPSRERSAGDGARPVSAAGRIIRAVPVELSQEVTGG